MAPDGLICACVTALRSRFTYGNSEMGAGLDIREAGRPGLFVGDGARLPGRCVILCAMLSEHLPNLSTFSESGPFSLYRAILRELKSRGVIRTENAPVGDYAEYLVATALGGQLAANSEKSWDVLSENGEKLQVKARVVSEPQSRANCSYLRSARSASTLRSSCCVSCRLRRGKGIETASPRGRIRRGLSSACERQGLVCPPGNHEPSRRNGPNRNSSGSTDRPRGSLTSCCWFWAC